MSMFIMDVQCLVVDDTRSTDRSALLAFKDGITEDPLGVLSTWNEKNDSLHFCQWKGVACSRRYPNRVTKLALNSQRMVGLISPHIGNLSFLTDFDLNSNNLHGKLPHQIGRLSQLKHFNLSYNSLEGEIPENISRCSNLIHFDITRNKFVGNIPNEIGYLFNLKILMLAENYLSGEIPASLGNLSSLTILYLRLNNLEGRIPSTLSQLTSLEFLGLDSNKLSGTVPSSLYNISSLEDLALMFNQLHGSIPSDIGFTLPNLKRISVHSNNFTGTIPNSFSNMSGLTVLQLGANKLVGSVPYNLGNLKNLFALYLGLNNLGHGQANDLSFLNSLVNCTNLRILIVGGNNFRGVLPSSISNLTTNLSILVLAENQIYGSVPAGIQYLVGLTFLHLNNNLLTGSIPSGIGNLQNLGILYLGENKFSGSIPSSFGNLTQLIDLSINDNNLTGLIPSSIGYCTSLEILELQGNQLRGSIPKQVFQLPSLSNFLSLAMNSFTGSIPAEIGNLKHLGVFDMSENKLSGEIPATIGDCSSLTYLNLQGNFFQGNIPSAITSLKGLETLSLSRNNLSGIIPKKLETLKFFVLLDLSSNDLEGEVPREGVFKNTSAFSIEGNTKLCGGIPDLKLPNCSIPLNPKEAKQRKPMRNKVRIIIIVSALLILILIVFLLTLYWRNRSKCMLTSTPLDVDNRLMGVSYNELLKATNGFNDSTNLLGVGSFGSVYKGLLQQDESKPIAVKVLHLQQKGATKSFMDECNALRKVRHRNLLKIITCCSSTDFQGNPFKALVFELMVNGSLENWLHPTISDVNNDDQLQVKNLNLERRLSIAVDVAFALNYLHHDSQSPIVHCDVKPSNVLLDDDLTAHVGDFGLAKFLINSSSNSRQLNEQDASSVAINGSIGYVSPEYGMGGEVSTQGDVYSYGILLLEMFIGKRPTDDMFRDGLNIHDFCKMHELPEHIEEVIDSRLLMELREDHNDAEITNYNILRNDRIRIDRDRIRQILASIIQIGIKCSSVLPSDRCGMNEVVVDVQAVKNQFLGVGM